MRVVATTLIVVVVAACGLRTATATDCNETLSPSTTWATDVELALSTATGPGAFVLCLSAGDYTGCGSGVSMATAGGGPTTLLGLGAVTVNCEGAGRAFDVAGASVNATVENIEVVNGRAGDDGSDHRGGVARVSGGASATFKDVSFTNSSNSAVYVNGSYVAVVDSVLANNVADGNGGSLAAENGATVSVTGTAIRSSTAVYGGGVYAAGEGTMLVLTESTVEDCYSELEGGGVRVEGYAECTCHDAVVGNNTSLDDGAGIACDGNARLEVTGNTRIVNNYCDEDGGGVSIKGGSTARVTDSSDVSHNVADVGGGFLVQSSVDYDGTFLELSGSVTVTYNAAPYSGCGLHVTHYGFDTGGATVVITGSVAITHNADFDAKGGGIAVGADTTVILSGEVSVSHNFADWGGGIEVMDRKAVFNASGSVVISDNTASLGGGILTMWSAKAYLDSVTVTNNVADYGGGFYAKRQNSNITCINCTVTGNVADDAGGGAYASHCAWIDFTYTSTVAGNSPDQVFVDGDYGCAAVVGYTPPPSTTSSTTSSSTSASATTTMTTTDMPPTTADDASTTSSSGGWELTSSGSETSAPTESSTVADSAATRTTLASGTTCVAAVVAAAAVLLA